MITLNKVKIKTIHLLFQFIYYVVEFIFKFYVKMFKKNMRNIQKLKVSFIHTSIKYNHITYHLVKKLSVTS